MSPRPTFQALQSWKQVLSHVGVGMGAASFWRGAWYILDDQLFPDNPSKSAVASLTMGTCGMAASQGMVSRALDVRNPLLKPVARFGALYLVAISCVLVWRGTWVGWDCVYEKLYHSTTAASSLSFHASALGHSPAHTTIKSTDPGHLTTSGLASHGFAIVALGAAGVFASVLAPPAAVAVIKDLAIQGSRRSSTTTASSTTQQRALNYFNNNNNNYANRRQTGMMSVGQMDVSSSGSSSSSSFRSATPATTTTGSSALEFIPSMAGYYMATSRRSMATSSSAVQSTRGALFRSTTGTFTKGGARLP